MATATVEDVGPCKKLLRVVVPAEDVQKTLDEQYASLRESVNVSGFRKGHAPRQLLEKRFGEQVVEEVKETLMRESCAAALEENSLSMIGQPSYDKVEFAVGSDFAFDVTVEVEPEFEVPEYKGLKLVRPKAEATEEDVGRLLERIRREHATYEEVADGAIEADDALRADWSIECEGEQVASEDNALLHSATQHVGGVEIQGLPEALAGAKVGETREAVAAFPEDHPREPCRGKQGRIAVKVVNIYRPRLPELDDAFAKALDFDDLEDLKAEVRTRLQHSAERAVQDNLEQQAIEQLLDAVPFAIPEGMVKLLSREMLLRQQLRMRHEGVAEEDIQNRLQSLQGMSEEMASQHIRVMFLFDRIAAKEKLFVTEDELAARLDELAARTGKTVQQVKREMEERGGGESSLRAQMRDVKVMQTILSHAEIQDAT